MPKSETFVYHIIAATWSINNITPVFIALGVPSCLKEHSNFYATELSQEINALRSFIEMLLDNEFVDKTVPLEIISTQSELQESLVLVYIRYQIC